MQNLYNGNLAFYEKAMQGFSLKSKLRRPNTWKRANAAEMPIMKISYFCQVWHLKCKVKVKHGKITAVIWNSFQIFH
jgi:hypothetical protein